jgi:O-antigen/teichoic acid export membrane protein
MPESLRQKTKNGIMWSLIERFSNQAVFFVLMIFMARLLSPSDYGVLGMLGIFLAVANSLIDCGFCQALVRKQDRTDVDNSTVFYFNIVVGVVLYGVLFLIAPWVAKFYDLAILCPVLRVQGIMLIWGSLSLVQRANLTAKVDFKTIAAASFTSTVTSGLTGLFLAYRGWGVWALVSQQMVSSTIGLLVLWKRSPWRPILAFSWQSLREMFGFGSKLMASGLIDTIYGNIYGLVIGKVFSAESLGYYSRASHFAQFPSSNITSVVSRVTYPILCSIQSEDERLRNVYRQFIRLFAFVVFPMMVGLSAVAHPLVQVLLGSKWAYCAVLLQIRCFTLMWYPIHSLNLNLLMVKGRSDLFLRLEILKKIVGVIILCITVPLGLEAMCYGGIASSIICLAINTHYTGMLIQVGFLRQMQDIFPTFLLSVSMHLLVVFLLPLFGNDWIQLIAGTLIGAAYFLLASKLLHFTELHDLIALVKKQK